MGNRAAKGSRHSGEIQLMPSRALLRWHGKRSADLDEIENAHASVGGSGPGRRYATEQINHAYATLLSAQFQGYCRDLHTECSERILAATPAALQQVVRIQFMWRRALDEGNPNPGNVGSDFNRFGEEFWRQVLADRSGNGRRRDLLEELNRWRNAIAHQHFDPARLGGTVVLHLARVRMWRRALNRLARSFDNVMYSYLGTLLGVPPW
jgi:hypothetical protein